MEIRGQQQQQSATTKMEVDPKTFCQRFVWLHFKLILNNNAVRNLTETLDKLKFISYDIYNKFLLSSIGCMEHLPISLVCAPQCQTSCTALCPSSCCTEASLQYRGIYSSPAVSLQPVYTNQCPSPCPSSCAPRCSLKCCNAVIYRSPLHLKRKVIGRKRTKAKNKLRKLRNLHQLKNAIKLSQNWRELGVSKTNHCLASFNGICRYWI